MENRLKEAVQKVNAREQRLASEFEFSAKFLNSSAYRKEKLKDYEQILKKKWHGLSREEKLYRKLLRQQCNEMEKRLYPNRYIRLLKNLTKLALAMGSVIKRPVLDEPILQSSLLRKAGFADIQPRAESLVKKGIDDFVVPVNRSMSAKQQVEYNISFSRDGKHIKPDKIIASLQTEGEAGHKSIAVNIDSDGKTLNQKQLYNLLAGRFVKQGDNWLRVDFNDCDAKGRLTVKEFTAVDFDMRQQLKKLPGWEQLNGINMGKIIEGLENGDRVKLPVADEQNGAFTLIQVNPLKRQLEHFDQQGNPIGDERQNFSRQLELLFNNRQEEEVAANKVRVKKVG